MKERMNPATYLLSNKDCHQKLSLPLSMYCSVPILDFPFFIMKKLNIFHTTYVGKSKDFM